MDTSKISPQSISTTTAWALQRPTTMQFLDQLNQQDIPWGIYCGSVASLLTGNRQTNDLDIVIRPQDFHRVKNLAPNDAKICDNNKATVTCGDGLVLDFPERSIKFYLDGQEIEIMATGDAQCEHHQYKLGMSELSIQNRLRCTILGTTLYFANTFDTIALKLILQRDSHQKKSDSHDIASLSALYPPPASYALKRAKEVRLDKRAWRYLQICNSQV